MKTINEFLKYREAGKKISTTTCYDYWSALIINETEIDAVLVGDSAAMVMHGFDSTVSADVDMMKYHIAAVKRGLNNKFLIADIPFLANRKGVSFLMNTVDSFIKAGANAVKIEGAGDNIPFISAVIKSGIPVMGHLGLTPQFVNQLGGYKLQAVNNTEVKKILKDAKELQNAGCFSVVLEMIPSLVAKRITNSLSIPTIGIGAGKYTNGQVLVLHDLLGLTKNFQPKFLKKYLNGISLITDSLNKFNSDVKSEKYPAVNESF